MRPDSLITQRFDALLALRPAMTGEEAFGRYSEFSAAAMGLVARVFGADSSYHLLLEDSYKTVRMHGVVGSAVQKAFGALKAARDDYTGGYLAKTRTIIRAEISEDVLAQAEELLNAGYKDPACVLAGVTLEISLRDLCDRHSISHAKLDKMNADLAGRDAYNKGMQKQITTWAHWRNDGAHGKWDGYSADQVRDMIAGIRRFVAEYL